MRERIRSAIKIFRMNSVVMRNMALILTVVFVLMGTIGALFYFNARESREHERDMILRTNAATIRDNFDTVLKDGELIALQTAMNQNVLNFCLFSPSESVLTGIRDSIANYTTVFPYIHSIYIYSNNKDLLIENQQVFPYSKYSDTNWYAPYKQLKPDKTLFLNRKKYDRFPELISIVRCVSIDHRESIGCVVVNLELRYFSDALKNSRSVDSVSTAFLSDDGKIFSGAEGVSDKAKAKIQNLKASDGKITLDDGNKYFYQLIRSKEYEYSYAALLPASYKGASGINFWTFILIVFVLLLAGVAIASVITYQTYKPIGSVLNEIYKTQSPAMNERRDEVEFIIERIRGAQDKNIRLEEQLNNQLAMFNQMQVYALQSQLNPHFLNNTLDSINWTAISRLGENNPITDIIKPLSKLLYISLDSAHYLVRMEEELKHTNIYIYIISKNYKDKLNFIWDIQQGISSCKMLKLTLQPIIENAIMHGIRPKGGGVIAIRAKFEGENILVEIEDDGVGMTEEDLKNLVRNLKDDTQMPDRNHVGLKNVGRRIRLVFGDEYGITVESKKDAGTCIKILIPKIEY